jgi:hypothetical protein
MMVWFAFTIRFVGDVAGFLEFLPEISYFSLNSL